MNTQGKVHGRNFELLQQWDEAQKALAEAKKIEATLRAQVAAKVFNYDEDELKKGTVNLELNEGYVLKGTFGVRHTLNNKDDATNKALDKMEAIGGEEGKFLADRLVEWKPSLKVAEYERLPSKYKVIIDSVLTTKSATPTFAILQPKSK